MKNLVKQHLPVIIATLVLIILIVLPTGYEGALIYQGMDRCRAEVLEEDSSMIIDTGLIRSGEQICRLKLLGGNFKGQESSGFNLLNGSLESDKIYKVGDVALVVISHQDDTILSVNMIDHYRLDKEAILLVIFAVFLIVYAKGIGVRSLLSFIISVLTIWKLLIPGCLDGGNPITIGLILTGFLTIIIISMVYGYDKRCLASSAGVMLGVLTTCIMGIVFTDVLKIHGAVMAYSESLLYAGYQNLNLTKIFMSSIFIGASGALMDIAVDITSAINEVIQKKPDITRKEAIQSGFNVGRAAMGTMTTTLLLAYSGGYIALLMVFMAQGTPVINILNYKYVSAEILQTLAGSFGLVSVAPFTALVSGILLVDGNKEAGKTANGNPPGTCVDESK